MTKHDQVSRGRARARQELCDSCRLAQSLAERIARVSEELMAERTPDDLRTEAVELRKQADGLEAGTIAPLRHE